MSILSNEDIDHDLREFLNESGGLRKLLEIKRVRLEIEAAFVELMVQEGVYSVKENGDIEGSKK